MPQQDQLTDDRKAALQKLAVSLRAGRGSDEDYERASQAQKAGLFRMVSPELDQLVSQSVADRSALKAASVQKTIPKGPAIPKMLGNPAEALPQAGAMAGSMVTMAGGPLAGAGGAALGGAAGEAGRQLMNRATGLGMVPETGEEAATDIAISGGVQGAAEGLLRGTGRMAKHLTNRFFNRITSREAAELFAKEISTADLSPAAFGAEIQDAFDVVTKAAGKEKAAAVKALGGATIRQSDTINAMQAAIDRLRRVGPPATRLTEGTAGKSTLEVMEQELQHIKNRGGNLSLADADELNGILASIGRELDPGLAAQSVGNVKRAVLKDIEASLNPAQKEQYMNALARVRGLADVGRADVLSEVFGSDRVSTGRVREFLMKDPEAFLNAVRFINNKGNVVALDKVRRAVFEEVFASGGKVPTSVNPEMLRTVFAENAPRVEKFITVMAKGEHRGGPVDFTSMRIPGTGARIGLSDESSKLIEIPVTKMAELLKNPKVLDDFTKLASAEQMTAGMGNAVRAFLGTLAQAAQKPPPKQGGHK